MESREENLIELVRNLPVLFNTSDPNYMKIKLKNDIWTTIANEINFTNGDEAKSAWVKLRNNHRDALRRQQRMKKSGAAAADIKRWKFQSQMEFLLRFMVNEKRDTNFRSDDDSSEPPVEQETDLGLDTERHEDNLMDKTCKDSTAPNTSVIDESDSAKSPVEKDPSEPQTQRPKKKAKKIDVDNLIRKTVEQREQRSKERSEERKLLKDDLQLFFMSMYEQTKKMPAASQHIVKNNIFYAVSQEEGRLLNIPDPGAPTYQPFPSGIGIMHNINQPRSNIWSDFSNTHSSASTSSSHLTTSHPMISPSVESSDNSDIVSYVNNFSE